MATLAIKGNASRSEDIRKLFFSLGAREFLCDLTDEKLLYYIAHDKKVISIPDQPDNIYRKLLFNVYTIEEFELRFPFRVGDEVTYDVSYSMEEPFKKVSACIKRMSWDTEESGVCYTMDSGTKRGVDEIQIVKPKFEPKDGDIVTYMNGDKATIYVFAGGRKYNTSFYVAYSGLRNTVFKDLNSHLDMNRNDIRPATEEEKKKLFDRLAEEGLDWDPEKKELVKLKWKPRCGQTVFLPDFKKGIFKTLAVVWLSGESDSMLQKGMVFNTQEDCQVFCDKLNQAIEGVKP